VTGKTGEAEKVIKQLVEAVTQAAKETTSDAKKI